MSVGLFQPPNQLYQCFSRVFGWVVCKQPDYYIRMTCMSVWPSICLSTFRLKTQLDKY